VNFEKDTSALSSSEFLSGEKLKAKEDWVNWRCNGRKGETCAEWTKIGWSKQILDNWDETWSGVSITNRQGQRRANTSEKGPAWGIDLHLKNERGADVGYGGASG